jgi:DNA-binding Lrp family transcriptional regulator
MEMAPERIRVDDKDRRIVECLIRDPQASVSLIADQTSFPASTVQKHIAKLVDHEHLGRGIYVKNWAAVGYPFKSRVDIEVNRGALATGNGGPPNIEQSPGDPVPILLPRPAHKIYTQEQLALYIRNELCKVYSGKLIIESISLLMGASADISLVIHTTEPAVVWAFVSTGLGVLGGVMNTTSAYETISY